MTKSGTYAFHSGISGYTLPFRVFDKIQTVTPGAIVENRRFGAALAMVKEHQATYAPTASLRSRAGPAAEQSEAPGMPTKNRTWRVGLPRISPGIRRTHGCSMMLGGG